MLFYSCFVCFLSVDIVIILIVEVYIRTLVIIGRL